MLALLQPLTLAKIDIFNKKQKLYFLIFYNILELSILEFFILLKNKITIFFTNIDKKLFNY